MLEDVRLAAPLRRVRIMLELFHTASDMQGLCALMVGQATEELASMNVGQAVVSSTSCSCSCQVHHAERSEEDCYLGYR